SGPPTTHTSPLSLHDALPICGEETRSNKWLAELQQDMFVEINPADAAERGIKDGAWVWVSGPEMAGDKACRMKALVTERVGKGRSEEHTSELQSPDHLVCRRL